MGPKLSDWYHKRGTEVTMHFEKVHVLGFRKCFVDVPNSQLSWFLDPICSGIQMCYFAIWPLIFLKHDSSKVNISIRIQFFEVCYV